MLCRSELAAEFEGLSEREMKMASLELRGRFSKAGERRAITAELIAQYLRSTAVTEKILDQRKKHQESVSIKTPTPPAQLDSPTTSQSEIAPNWAFQPTEELGEF